MLKLATTALVAALSAAGASKLMIDMASAHPAQAATAQAAVVQTALPAASGVGASIAKSPDGHFWAQAQIGDHAVRLLVDTGASAVMLTPDDAARLGFPAAGLTFDHTVYTANGPARAALITLPSLSVAGVSVPQVQALVAEKGLDASLLGMTYLGRLSRFEATPAALVLRP